MLVFTRTKHGADRVVLHLAGAGIEATGIHGNKSQPQRERALAGFRDGQTRVLVATDIAARGIDVDGVSHVINFDLPNVPEDYVHRIGRTARAGAAGIAIAFCSDEERPYLRDIEKLTRCPLRTVLVPSAIPAPRNGAIARPVASNLPPEGSHASRQAPAKPESVQRDTRRGPRRPSAIHLQPSGAARPQPNLVRRVAAASGEAAPLPFDAIVSANRIGNA